MEKPRPHVLGVDDGPFEKGQAQPVPLVAVMMEGPDVIEGIALSSFPVDGDAVTEHLAAWIASLRSAASLQAVMLGGITIVGLAVTDVRHLNEKLGVPVIVVTRRDPAQSRVNEALRAAGLEERIAIVDATPAAVRLDDGLYVASAGLDVVEAERIVRATVGKALVPEPLRVAHLIARALVDGESKGRA